MRDAVQRYAAVGFACGCGIAVVQAPAVAGQPLALTVLVGGLIAGASAAAYGVVRSYVRRSNRA